MLAVLSCRELLEFLDAHLSAELPESRRRVFDSHLAACVPCARYARTYLESIRIAKAAAACADEPAVRGVPEELVRAICAARGAAVTRPAGRHPSC